MHRSQTEHRPLHHRAGRGGAFTLIEVLVIIGIIAILAAILMPVLSRARAASQSVSCLSNLRQSMMAFNLYAADNRQIYPDPFGTGQSWESLLRPYLARDTYHCKSDGGLFDKIRSSYDWRDTPDHQTTAAGVSRFAVRRPNIVFVFDALPDWHGPGKINAARIDGAAQSMSYQECLEDLDTSIYRKAR